VGYVVAEIRRRIDDTTTQLTISLLSGYVAYIPAAELGLSGVLAVVTAGLWIGWQAPTLISPQTRLEGTAMWRILVFLLNATLFMLIGLQLPLILDGVANRTTSELIGYAALVCATVIGARFVWNFTAPYVVRALDRRPQQRLRRVGWRLRVVSAWSGMRGAVSLAAALALPLTTDAGARLPDRDLILFITYALILVTIVGQGLTLPWLIRVLRVTDDGVSAREELHARKAATRAALDELQRLDGRDGNRPDTLERMRGLYEFRYRRLAQRAGYRSDEDEEDAESRSHDYQRIVHGVLAAQRRELIRLRDGGEIGDDALNVVLRELDLEEERLDS
jgi:monovalent cation/hydrogen antiporter